MILDSNWSFYLIVSTFLFFLFLFGPTFYFCTKVKTEVFISWLATTFHIVKLAMIQAIKIAWAVLLEVNSFPLFFVWEVDSILWAICTCQLFQLLIRHHRILSSTWTIASCKLDIYCLLFAKIILCNYNGRDAHSQG